ncbi:uncharacterized protein LOC129012635 [Pongo pygmaeus]|uniref:uncharacterized protein LOC129012635 n=1 Tax=Pongo pygmaeus TaxID=9600 RepID=UPI0023E157DF|nr:uncharacterized protein LOC129012635 [Pongo pygmaeus]
MTPAPPWSALRARSHQRRATRVHRIRAGWPAPAPVTPAWCQARANICGASGPGGSTSLACNSVEVHATVSRPARVGLEEHLPLMGRCRKAPPCADLGNRTLPAPGSQTRASLAASELDPGSGTSTLLPGPSCCASLCSRAPGCFTHKADICTVKEIYTRKEKESGACAPFNKVVKKDVAERDTFSKDLGKVKNCAIHVLKARDY